MKPPANLLSLTLGQCELFVIRYLAQVAEKLSHGLTTFGSVRFGRERDAQDAIKRLCDQIEHVAQYALEGLPESARATFLAKDIEALTFVLTEFEGDMPAAGDAPNVEDLALLLAGLHRVADQPTA